MYHDVKTQKARVVYINYTIRCICDSGIITIIDCVYSSKLVLDLQTIIARVYNTFLHTNIGTLWRGFDPRQQKSCYRGDSSSSKQHYYVPK